MADVAHVIGNGSSASFYTPQKGLKIACNLPPMAVPNIYASIIVDFKMFYAMREGSVVVPGDWVLGARPRRFMEDNPSYHMQYARQIKEFYLTLPKYVPTYTDFSCGHMAVHYTANKLKAKEISLYGFNSMFDFDLYSSTDFYLESDRGSTNTHRLANNWRNIWPNMFAEFPDTQFIIYHKHSDIKFSIPENVEIRTSA